MFDIYNGTVDFNSKTGEFVGFHYDTEEDIWEFGAVELERFNYIDIKTKVI